MDDAERMAAFLLAEYEASANAYFKGVDIGYTGTRFYITINSLFAGIVGVLADHTRQLLVTNYVLKLCPFLALLFSLAMLFVLPHYFEHLENCRRRCEEIEQEWSGTLFTRMGEIARRRRTKAGPVVVVIILAVSCLWAVVAYRLWV